MPMILLKIKGGPGSGHHGHRGRPGIKGGSLPGKGSVSPSGKGVPYARSSAPPVSGPITAEPDVDSMVYECEVVEQEGTEVLRDAFSDVYASYESLYLRDPNAPKVAVLMKDKVVTELAQDAGLDYDTTNHLVRQWAITANDHDPESLVMQKDAAKELGVKLSAWQRSRIKSTPSIGITTSESERRAYIRAVYDRTQEYLREQGFKPGDKVTLYRGYSTSKSDDSMAGDTVGYYGNALESWTVSRLTAYSYGNKAYYGRVVAAEVPVERIVSTPMTGFGCLGESEIIIMGSDLGDVTVVYSSVASE